MKKSVFLIFFCLLFFVPAHAEDFEIPAAITAEISYLRDSPDADLKQRLESLESLIAKLRVLPLLTVQEALSQSDLAGTRTLDILQQYSRGIIALSDLRTLPLAQAYSLGLSSQGGIYEMLAERFGLTMWPDAYAQFKIDWHTEENHTDVFLRRVQASGKPVVFFLPNKTLSYRGKSITVNELKWFLKDQTRLRNVYFVFGAYDLISPELEELRAKAGLSRDAFRALFMRALGASESSYDQML